MLGGGRRIRTFKSSLSYKRSNLKIIFLKTM